jgi:hypothetical protein
VTEQIRELLVQQGVTERAASWFDETKSRLKIEIEPATAALVEDYSMTPRRRERTAPRRAWKRWVLIRGAGDSWLVPVVAVWALWSGGADELPAARLMVDRIETGYWRQRRRAATVPLRSPAPARDAGPADRPRARACGHPTIFSTRISWKSVFAWTRSGAARVSVGDVEIMRPGGARAHRTRRLEQRAGAEG